MSEDKPFPMPREVSATATALGNEFAPPAYKREALGAVERELRSSISSYGATTDPINQIKAQIKLLTHRQMREMCAAIFAAKEKLKQEGDSISKTDLPDVLDKFAYGD